MPAGGQGGPQNPPNVIDDTVVSTTKTWSSQKITDQLATKADAVATAQVISDETTNRTNADAALQSQINNEVTVRATADTVLQANIDAEASARVNGINNEINARTAADTVLQGNIDAEANIRATADTALQGNIDAEATTRSAADTALQAGIDAGVTALNNEIAARTAADTVLQGNIDAEANVRATADTALQTNIDAEATARSVADAALQAGIDAGVTALNNEIAARTAADTVLQGNIDAEANIRATADTTLQTNIDAEATARSVADAALQANIDTEASARANAINDEIAARIAADQALQAGIDAGVTALNDEIAARTAADTVLQGNIDAEANIRATADTTLQTNIDAEASARANAINDEIAARTAADQALQAGIDAGATALNDEIAARTAADTVLQGNIDAEANVRATADTMLQTNIDAEASARANAINNEIAARTAADQVLQAGINAGATALNDEIAARTAADTVLQGNINAETSARANAINNEIAARTAADQALQAGIDAGATAFNDEIAARTAADTVLQGNINAEASARISADKGLQDQITKEIADRMAGDKTLQVNINAEAAARDTADKALQANIDAEVNARTVADKVLQDQINTEAVSRIDADQQLKATIRDIHIELQDIIIEMQDSIITSNTNVMALENKTTDLQNQILKEATDHTIAEKTLQANIDAEASTRDVADKDLQGQITKEASVRTDADKTLQANIDAEAGVRDATDKALQSNIDAETAARKTEDKALQANLDVEASVRLATDKDLQDQITKEVAARTNADKQLEDEIQTINYHYDNLTAFNNVLVGGINLQADSRTDTLEIVAGTNISIAADVVNDRLTINNTYEHPTSDGNLHIPVTGTTNNGKVLKAGATAGSVAWENLSANEISNIPVGNIVASTVQAAINELDAEKVNISDVVTTATANKILKLDANAKLPASITGDADTVDGYHAGNASGNIPVSNGTVCTNLNADKLQGMVPDNFALKVHYHDLATPTSNGFMSSVDKAKLDDILPGAEVNQNAFSNILAGGTTLVADCETDTLEIAGGTNISITADAAADKLTIHNTYTYTHPAGDGNLHVPATGTTNNTKVLKAGETAGSLTWQNVAFSEIAERPTDLRGYGITDAVESSDVVTTATPNKLLKLDANGKLPASITGDANTVNGYSVGNASGNIPVSNGTVCTDLNAYKLQGMAPTDFAPKDHDHDVATASSKGFMSSADKIRLDAIQELNQYAFNKIVIRDNILGETTLEADCESDTVEIVAGTNISITADAANDKLTINNDYVQPIASANQLGGVRIGDNITISADGTISSPVAKDSQLGVVKIGDGLTCNDGLLSVTNSIQNEAEKQMKECVVNGLDLSPGLATDVQVTQGTAYINENIVNVSAQSISLDLLKPALICCSKSDNSGAGTINKIYGKWPAASETEALVAQYDFDEDGDLILDHSPRENKNDLQVVITPNTTGICRRVPGWIGYSRQLDGTANSYMKTNNMVTFTPQTDPLIPIQRDFTYCFTYLDYTTNSNNLGVIPFCLKDNFFIKIEYNGLLKIWVKVIGYLSTGFYLEQGQTYVVEVTYDGTNWLVYVNGKQVLSYQYSSQIGNEYLYIGRYSANTSYNSKSIHHFVQIREDVRLPHEVARVANEMLIPCQYNWIQAKYPALTGSYNQWYFDEATGNDVNDSGLGTMHGTACNAIIIDSIVKEGQKKARRFTGTTTSRVTLGNQKFAPAFGFFALVEIRKNDSYRGLFGNYAGGTSGNIIATSYAGNGKLGFYGKGKWTYGTQVLPLRTPIVVGVVVAEGNAYFYANTSEPEIITGVAVDDITNNPCCIGNYGNDIYGFAGDIHYAMYLTRKPSQEEVDKIFSALKYQSVRNIVEDVTGNTDSIALGMVRTNDSKVIDVDLRYKYGRRNNPFLDKKRWFSGWKSAGVNQNIFFDNPFGTENVKVTVFFKRQLWDRPMSISDGVWSYDSSTGGGYTHGTWVKSIDFDKIILGTGSRNVNFVTYEAASGEGSAATGFLAVLLEVFDNEHLV